MNKKQILVVGRDQETLQRVVQLINQNEDWIGKGSTTDDKAIEMFRNGTFDMVLLGGGLEVESGIKLREAFTSQKPNIIILQHFGGIGTLVEDIKATLQTESTLA